MPDPLPTNDGSQALFGGPELNFDTPENRDLPPETPPLLPVAEPQAPPSDSGLLPPETPQAPDEPSVNPTPDPEPTNTRWEVPPSGNQLVLVRFDPVTGETLGPA